MLRARRDQLLLQHEIAYGAAWYGAAIGRSRRIPSFDEAMRPFRGAPKPAGPVEDDDAVRRAIDAMVARADAAKAKPKGRGR